MGIESTTFQTLVDALTTELLSAVNSKDEQVICGNQKRRITKPSLKRLTATASFRLVTVKCRNKVAGSRASPCDDKSFT